MLMTGRAGYECTGGRDSATSTHVPYRMHMCLPRVKTRPTVTQNNGETYRLAGTVFTGIVPFFLL